jgi:hypothetical protein
MQKIVHYVVGTLISFTLGMPYVYAQAATTLTPKDNKCMKSGDCHLSDIPFFIKFIAEYLVGIAGTISVIMVMWGGYQWIMGGVSEDQKGKGKKTLSYAIIGLVITLLSWVIVNVIQINVTT